MAKKAKKVTKALTKVKPTKALSPFKEMEKSLKRWKDSLKISLEDLLLSCHHGCQ